MSFPIKNIAIAGGGTMGRGIALVAAKSGYRVFVRELNPEVMNLLQPESEKYFRREIDKERMTPEQGQQALENLATGPDFGDFQADLFIEAVPENLPLKISVMQEALDRFPNLQLAATNTSTLPVTRIAAGLSTPEIVIGIHFFNPATLMSLVEVIPANQTDSSLGAVARAWIESLGKTAVTVRDTPGFVVNRAARFFYLESLRLVEDKAVSIEDMDKLMRATGFRMGPFELMDLIGVDTNHSVSQTLYQSFFQDPRYRPSWLQQEMVDAGRIGKKAGKGFYDNKSSG